MLNDLRLEAVVAAKKGLWTQAVELNQALLDQDPNDVEALNRLGVALMQVNKPTDAKRAFKLALKIDPKNNIAKKNLAKLKLNHSLAPRINSSQIFVEEPGKTKLVKLHRLADKAVLEKLSIGDEAHLKVKKRYVSVEVDGRYVGALPEDISFRLTKLMRTGNKYACYIKHAEANRCLVYLKETKRSKRNAHVHSFPTGGALTNDLNLPTTKDEYQETVPFEVLDLDQEDATKPPDLNTASTVIT